MNRRRKRKMSKSRKVRYKRGVYGFWREKIGVKGKGKRGKGMEENEL